MINEYGWVPLPVSIAENAYELLEEVCKIILEEPRRYNQGEWVQNVRFLNKAAYPTWPSCGTIGCVAGWVFTLKRQNFDNHTNTAWAAAQILGLTIYQADLLFSAGATGYTTPGTLAHARAGVKHIKKFMAEHEAQLRAKLV